MPRPKNLSAVPGHSFTIFFLYAQGQPCYKQIKTSCIIRIKPFKRRPANAYHATKNRKETTVSRPPCDEATILCKKRKVPLTHGHFPTKSIPLRQANPSERAVLSEHNPDTSETAEQIRKARYTAAARAHENAKRHGRFPPQSGTPSPPPT